MTAAIQRTPRVGRREKNPKIAAKAAIRLWKPVSPAAASHLDTNADFPIFAVRAPAT